MDLDELRRARHQLERDLMTRTWTFTKETGVPVRVNIEPRYAHTQTMTDGTRREIFGNYDITVTITSLD